MVYINNELQVIYMHIPKCGGCYVRELLIEYYDFYRGFSNSIHSNYSDFFDDLNYIQLQYDTDLHTIRKFGKYRYVCSHQLFNKVKMDLYFKFTFVRNPYEKIYSAYLYLLRSMQESNYVKIRNTPENSEYYVDFNIFIKNYKYVNNIAWFHAFITQYDQIIDFSGNINFQYIGKTENLDNDLLEVLNIIGIPEIKHIPELYFYHKQNASDYKIPIHEAYNEETFNFVNEFFAKDFEIFGYQKFNTFVEFKNYYIEKHKNTKIKITDNITKPLIQDFDFYNTVHSRVSKKITQNRLIPNNIIQTYTNNQVHPFIYENIDFCLYKNKDYNYIFITDEDGIKLIKEYFDENTLSAFLKLQNGPEKGDFLRYIGLYVYGGIYLDLDADIYDNINKILKVDTEFIFFYNLNDLIIYNWVFCIQPKHIIMQKVIIEIINRIHMYYGNNNRFIITGQEAFTTIIYNVLNATNYFNIIKELNNKEIINFYVNNDYSNGLFYNIIDYMHILQPKAENYKNNYLYMDTIKSKKTPVNYITTTKQDLYKNIICLDSGIQRYDNLYKKYNKIFEKLHAQIRFNPNNDIQLQIKAIYNEYSEIIERNKYFIDSIKDNATEIMQNKILENRNECPNCNFLCFSSTAFMAHTYFCGKTTKNNFNL
jgi:mannosyltransferase OCH1-like enzyme